MKKQEFITFDTMSGKGQSLAPEPLSITLEPRSVFSLNMLFNTGLWAVAGGFVGSQLSLPGPVSSAEFGGTGALLGGGAYVGLVLSKQGVSKWIQDYEDFIAYQGAETTPTAPQKVQTEFFAKYGVTIEEAIETFKQAFPVTKKPNYTDNHVVSVFYDWADQYYLHLDVFTDADVEKAFRRLAGNDWQTALNMAKFTYFGTYNHQKDDPLGINLNRFLMKTWIPRLNAQAKENLPFYQLRKPVDLGDTLNKLWKDVEEAAKKEAAERRKVELSGTSGIYGGGAPGRTAIGSALNS